MNGIRNLKGISITSFYKNLRKVMFYILVIFTMVILLKSASAEILVESDHPYANNYANTWTISEPGASQIRIHFSKIDIIKNDYVKILDKDGKELRIYGESYYNDYTPYLKEDFWTEWFVDDTLKVKFTANSIGTSYGFLVDQIETRTALVPESSFLAESDHPYANNYANTWTISEPGASQIRIHFSKIDIIKNDYVKILDKDGKELRIYGKSYYNDYTPYLIEDFWTEWFVGDTLKVKFTANSIGTSYGFLVDQKETRETSSTPTPLSTPVIPSKTTPTPLSTPVIPSKTTPTPTYISTTIAYPSGEGATPTPRIPDGNIDINMILSFIGVLATIIGVYFGYRATKKK